jgi:hypothetical protein
MMNRDPIELTLTIAKRNCVSDVAHVAGYTMFTIRPAAGTEGTHIQALEEYDGEGEDSKDEDDSLKIITFTAGEWKDLPTACATMHRLRLKTCSDDSGSAQDQENGTTIILRCKA